MTDPIALPVKRLPKQTLHHVWAPKLSRTVVLAGRDQLHLWVMLEAHPAVSRYCERPTWPDENETSPNPDFWALRDGRAVWLALGDAPQIDPNSAPVLPTLPSIDWIHADALNQHRVWIQNWLSLLPYLGATATPSFDSLVTQVIQATDPESSFDDLERKLSATDPLLVRTAVIAALHQGLLVSEDLQHMQWGRSTRVSKLSGGSPHATQ
jgi:hypothetical protein